LCSSPLLSPLDATEETHYIVDREMQLTRSKVFFARSLTKGLAITGIFSEAETGPVALLRR
jgi:hypothetical protein